VEALQALVDEQVQLGAEGLPALALEEADKPEVILELEPVRVGVWLLELGQVWAVVGPGSALALVRASHSAAARDAALGADWRLEHSATLVPVQPACSVGNERACRAIQFQRPCDARKTGMGKFGFAMPSASRRLGRTNRPVSSRGSGEAPGGVS
jgi:hypothetical protein